MAHPTFVIDLAVRHFMQLWHTGHQPSLTFNTLRDGDIVVTSSITCSPAVHQPKPEEKDMMHIKHRSGRNSRRRRQKKRAQINRIDLTTPNNTADEAANVDSTLDCLKISEQQTVSSEQKLFPKLPDDTFPDNLGSRLNLVMVSPKF